jgi:chromosome segregation ATPase
METVAERRERLAREQRGLDALAAAEVQITELRQQMEQKRTELDHARRQVEKAQQRAQDAAQARRDAQANLMAVTVEPVRSGAPIAMAAEMSGLSIEQIRRGLDEPIKTFQEMPIDRLQDEEEKYVEER